MSDRFDANNVPSETAIYSRTVRRGLHGAPWISQVIGVEADNSLKLFTLLPTNASVAQKTYTIGEGIYAVYDADKLSYIFVADFGAGICERSITLERIVRNFAY